MCLSTVYLLGKDQEKEFLCKNIASVSINDGKLRFTNLMGLTTEVTGTIETVDLIDNYITVRTGD